MSEKINLVATLSAPYSKDTGFVLSITSSSREIGGISTAQAILNFLSVYKDTFEIEVDKIVISDKIEEVGDRIYGENSHKYYYASISFNPTTETSNFYGPIADITGSIEDDITETNKNFSTMDLNYFLLGLFRNFISSANKNYEDHLQDRDLYYPCYEVFIRKKAGWLVESLPSDSRPDMLYFMQKLLKEGKICSYGIRHKGDISKPTHLENHVLKNRYGWFITLNRGKKLIGDNEQIRLSKKNFSFYNSIEKNIFDIFHSIDTIGQSGDEED